MKKVSTADRLNQIMKKNSLRQVDILEKSKPYCEQHNVRLGRNDLSQYVSGKVEPGQEKLSILAKALNVTESWLMGLNVPMQEEASLKSIIETRINELEISLEDVAKKSGVSLQWLQNIDDFIPGYCEDFEIGYERITKVAKVIGLQGSTLRAALARQEIPASEYAGTPISAEESIQNARDDFNEPYTEAKQTYYLNDDAREAAQFLFDNPEYKVLFDASRKVKKEDIDHIRKMLDLARRDNDDTGC